MELLLNSGAFRCFRHTLNLRIFRVNSRSLDLLTEVGTQCERAVIVQLLVASPPHGIAHSLYLNLGSKFQSFPIRDVAEAQTVPAESCPARDNRRPDNRS